MEKWKSGKVPTLCRYSTVCCCLTVCHLALIINNIINHLQLLRLCVLVSMISRVLNALEENYFTLLTKINTLEYTHNSERYIIYTLQFL